MSIEAIAYVKALDVSEPVSRLLLLIIGENTFNDSGLCKVGQKVLVDETRTSERTVRRHLKELVEKEVIKLHPQFKSGGGREHDAIELLGFLDWLGTSRSTKPVKMAGMENPQANRSNWPGHTGQQVAGLNRPMVAGSYKESRTSNTVQDARAREDFNSQIEKKEALSAIPLTAGSASWRAWMDHLRQIGRPELAEAAEVAGEMIAVSRWPKANSPLPIIDKARAAAKAVAERITGESAA